MIASCLALACLLGVSAAMGQADAAGASAPGTRLVFASSGKLWAVGPQGQGLHAFARIPRSTNDISASQNGRRITVITHKALQSPRQGSVRKIYLWRKGRGLKLLLRIHTIADSSVAISADGSEIAYGKDNDIWLMKADSTDKHRVTIGLRRAFDPAFAPSGKNLYFVRQSANAGGNRIFRVPLNQPFHSEVGLTPASTAAIDPVVSSRGLVAFVQLGDGGSGGTPDRIRVTQANGSNIRTITRSNDPKFNLDPDFSPNGRAISYLRLREVNGDHSPRRYSLRTIRTSGSHTKIAVAHLSARPRGLQWTGTP